MYIIYLFLIIIIYFYYTNIKHKKVQKKKKEIETFFGKKKGISKKFFREIKRKLKLLTNPKRSSGSLLYAALAYLIYALVIFPYSAIFIIPGILAATGTIIGLNIKNKKKIKKAKREKNKIMDKIVKSHIAYQNNNSLENKKIFDDLNKKLVKQKRKLRKLKDIKRSFKMINLLKKGKKLKGKDLKILARLPGTPEDGHHNFNTHHSPPLDHAGKDYQELRKLSSLELAEIGYGADDIKLILAAALPEENGKGAACNPSTTLPPITGEMINVDIHSHYKDNFDNVDIHGGHDKALPGTTTSINTTVPPIAVQSTASYLNGITPLSLSDKIRESLKKCSADSNLNSITGTTETISKLAESSIELQNAGINTINTMDSTGTSGISDLSGRVSKSSASYISVIPKTLYRGYDQYGFKLSS